MVRTGLRSFHSRLSSSQSVSIPKESTTVAVTYSATSGLPSAWVLRPLTVPPLPHRRDSVFDDLQVPVDFTREQPDAATHFNPSRFADLETVCNDLAVASATVSGLN